MIVGIGVDIVDIRRIRRILERQGGRFMQRVFTPQEQAYCLAHRDSAPYFAVRFAAKEALFKAMGMGWSGGLTWRDVEVSRSDIGAPGLVLHGRAKEMIDELGARTLHVSLSHAEETGVAFVILETGCPSPHGGD